MVLALTVVGHASWIRVVGPHDHVLYIGIARHGKTLRFVARPLTITLGNAGAVRVAHGRTVLRHAGRAGQVRTLHITR
jgi:hypothetical protein